LPNLQQFAVFAEKGGWLRWKIEKPLVLDRTSGFIDYFFNVKMD
jgi:hypothetical protein